MGFKLVAFWSQNLFLNNCTRLWWVRAFLALVTHRLNEEHCQHLTLCLCFFPCVVLSNCLPFLFWIWKLPKNHWKHINGLEFMRVLWKWKNSCNNWIIFCIICLCTVVAQWVALRSHIAMAVGLNPFLHLCNLPGSPKYVWGFSSFFLPTEKVGSLNLPDSVTELFTMDWHPFHGFTLCLGLRELQTNIHTGNSYENGCMFQLRKHGDYFSEQTRKDEYLYSSLGYTLVLWFHFIHLLSHNSHYRIVYTMFFFQFWTYSFGSGSNVEWNSNCWLWNRYSHSLLHILWNPIFFEVVKKASLEVIYSAWLN